MKNNNNDENNCEEYWTIEKQKTRADDNCIGR